MKSKISTQKLIIASSLLVFISALIWKSTRVDYSEEVTKVEVKKVAKKVKNKEIMPEDTYDRVPNDEPKVTLTSEELKKAYRSEVELNMYLSSLRTPERFLEAITEAQNNGDSEKADKIIERLLLVYPDFKL